MDTTVGQAARKAPDLDSSELFPLSNAELWELARILQRNRSRELSELTAKDRERLEALRDRFHLFLWKAVGHQTSESQIAWHAVTRASEAFFARLGWSVKLTPLGGGVSRLVWRLQTPRSWIFRTVRQMVAELEEEQARGQLPEAPSPPGGALKEPKSGLGGLARDRCQLKCHRRPPNLVREGHCRRVCDMLFMLGLDFSSREIGYVLLVPKSTAFDRLLDCSAQLSALQRKPGSISQHA